MGTSLTATGVQFPDNSVQTAPALTGFRNRIINGNMRIAQRGTSFTTTYGYTVDRFGYSSLGISIVTLTQSTDVPNGSGLSNSLRATITTADTSIAVTDYSTIFQHIEGYNVADLVGVPITLSFWVKSSKVGIHCGKFANSVEDKSYVYEYSINTANTWEQKTIVIINGLINTGTWNFTNGKGLMLAWALAFGSNYQTATPNTWVSSNAYSTANQVNCLDTVGNIFAITGVQLEKGSTPTEFEFRPYQVELAMCQRYFCNNTAINGNAVTGYNSTSGSIYVDITFPIPMRASPSVTLGITSNLNANSAAVNVVTQLGIRVYSSIISTGAGYSVFTYAANAEL